MSTMKAMQVTAAGEDFEAVEKEIPSPGSDEVLIKVQACGICHSDAFVKDGLMPGIEYPRVPGHEVVGTIEERGNAIDQWEKRQRVGVGWHGGHCYKCEACRKGDFINCENGQVTGIHFDGGYAEYLMAPESALAAIPESLDAAEATNAEEELQKLGGADVILATAPNGEAISSVVEGLGRNGQLMVVAATNDSIEVMPLQLIMGRKSIAGWPSGDAKGSEETLSFSAHMDVTPKIETFPLEQANEAYDRMINNEARFRVVLDIG